MNVPQNKMIDSAKIDTLIAIGMAGTLSIALTYCFAAIVMMFGGTLTSIVSIIVMLAATGSSLAVVTRYYYGNKYLITAGVLAMLVLSAVCANLLIDTTIDGQNYHFEAIETLRHGWNPFYETAPDMPGYEALTHSIWIQHYPLGSWTVMATQIAAGIPPEAAKGLVIVFFLSSFLLTLGLVLRMGLALLPALLIGAIAAANPVVLAQLFTRMNDGLLASCLLILIVLTGFIVHSKDRVAMLAIAPVMIFALNLKFSAVPILIAFCGFFCAALWITQNLAKARNVGVYLVAAGIAGIFVIGFAPYGNNILGFGHPFFPLMGNADTQDIMTGNTPIFMEEMSPIKAFFFSLFAESHQGYAGEPSLKIPFTTSVEEIRAAGGADTRIAGFGPFFSGGFLIALVLGVLAWQKGREAKHVRGILATSAALLVIAIVFPESWWARYVPHLWLAPVGVALACYFLPKSRYQLASYALIGVLAANAGIVFMASTFLAQQRHAEVTTQIQELAATRDSYIGAFDLALSRVDLFRRAGIDITVVADIDDNECPSAAALAGYGPDRIGGKICRVSDYRSNQ